jgi:hypothetical protein
LVEGYIGGALFFLFVTFVLPIVIVVGFVTVVLGWLGLLRETPVPAVGFDGAEALAGTVRAEQPARSKSPARAGARAAGTGTARAGEAGAGEAGEGARGAGTEKAARRPSGDTPMVGGARGIPRVKLGRCEGCVPYEN